MSKEFLTKKPSAEVTICWPDKSETRRVRPAADGGAATARKSMAAPESTDEDYRVVMECAPYTASFNHLLSERRVNENPRTFASLVYERMRTDAVPMNTETYNLLMGRLVRFTDGSIFDLYEELKSEGTKESSSVQPSKETFVLLFRACERSAEYHRAFLLYQQMRDLFHLIPDTATYNTLLGFCAAMKDVAQACYLVDEMRTNGVPMDANTYNCYMSVLADTAPYAETVEVFNKMCEGGSRPTLRTYNTLLKAMRAHGDFDKGFQVYEEMKRKGRVPDIVTYNILLWMCEDRLDYVLGTGAFSHLLRTQEQRTNGTAAVSNLVLTLLAEMQSVGVSPNTFSYNKVLAVLLRCEDQRLFSVYTKAQAACIAPATAAASRAAPRRNPHPPALRRSPSTSSSQSVKTPLSMTTASVSVTMGDSSNAGSTVGAAPANRGVLSPRSAVPPTAGEAAASLEEAMCEEDPMGMGCIRATGVRANMETEKLIMRALLLFGQPERCKQLHMANRKLFAHFRMTTELARVLFEACRATRDQAWAESLLQELLALKLRVDTGLFNGYLAVLSEVADPALMEHFDKMKLGIHPLGVCADTQTFNIVIRGHLQQAQLAEALAIFAGMCEAYGSRTGNVTPDDDTYVLVLQVYNQLHDADAATDVVERALDKDVPVGASVCQQLLRLYLHCKDNRAEGWFERMKQAPGNGLPPLDAESYAIMMEYYLAEKRFDKVAQLFSALKTSETLEPTTSVYRVMIDMYKAQANRKSMMAVFDDARMNSVKMDVLMYNAVMETFVEAKDPFVFEVLSDMRENCIPPEDSTLAIFLASPAGRQQLSEAIAHHLFYKPSHHSYL